MDLTTGNMSVYIKLDGVSHKNITFFYFYSKYLFYIYSNGIIDVQHIVTNNYIVHLDTDIFTKLINKISNNTLGCTVLSSTLY